MTLPKFDRVSIVADYEAQEIPWEAYRSACLQHEELIFGNELPSVIPALPHPSTYTLCLGLFVGKRLVGWHYAHEDLGDILMRDTGLLPEHQHRGVYTKLLPMLLLHFTKCGFHRVRSRHRFENNAVIIAKLRAGFVIVGTEVENGVSYVKLSSSLKA